MTEPRKICGLTFKEWLVEAGFEINSPRMWPEDYEELQKGWELGADPYEYVGSKPRPPEFDYEEDTLENRINDAVPRVGSVVRYYDPRKDAHIEARVVEVEPFTDNTIGGLYLTLDNDMCVHEDNCKVVMR